ASSVERLAQERQVGFGNVANSSEIESSALPRQRAHGRRRRAAEILWRDEDRDSMRAFANEEIGDLVAPPVNDAAADQMELRCSQIGYGNRERHASLEP